MALGFWKVTSDSQTLHSNTNKQIDVAVDQWILCPHVKLLFLSKGSGGIGQNVMKVSVPRLKQLSDSKVTLWMQLK